ncbi:hypothetical protein [Actinacidiphila oryziradicis]|uniref:hypothetical protein n=1 Tax=Actinacidiphila oryziradicis TaxID=2571141 RepID=UPI00145D6C1E|nr:hypothetical protein [Actinacidiphila oryziradicis]
MADCVLRPAPRPADLFRLSSAQVVVPAHGSAGVTVTIDAAQGTGNGRYTGQVLATDPG